jgi:hypothetical protein
LTNDGLTKEGITRWFHKTEKEFVYNKVRRTEMNSYERSTDIHFCTPDDALVVRNILSFYI